LTIAHLVLILDFVSFLVKEKVRFCLKKFLVLGKSAKKLEKGDLLLEKMPLLYMVDIWWRWEALSIYIHVDQFF